MNASKKLEARHGHTPVFLPIPIGMTLFRPCILQFPLKPLGILHDTEGSDRGSVEPEHVRTSGRFGPTRSPPAYRTRCGSKTRAPFH